MSKRGFEVWLPEGINDYVTMAKAREIIDRFWSERCGYLWESREAGISAEETWDDSEHEHKTLRGAVAKAFPVWKKLGLTYYQAALTCFALGLVLSTGVEIEDA